MTIQENRTLLQKADLAIADFTSAGALQPAQADRFIQLAIKQAVFMQDIVVSTMKADREERNKMRFSSRVLRSGQEATALPIGSRSKPSMSQVVLSAKLFKAEARMSNEVLEDQIERGTFANTVMDTLAGAISRDLDSIAINGDTVSASAFLTPLDGVLKQATSNVFDAGSTRLVKEHLRDIHKALDDEFSEMPGLMFWTNRQAKIDYQDTLANRATAYGDENLKSRPPAVWNDMIVKSVPEFPPTAETGGSNTQVLHTSGQNIELGFHRKITIETDKDISAGVLIIVCSVRWDVKIHEVTAAAKGINVLGT